MLGAPGRPRILTVTELAAGVRGLLDEEVGWVWVAGELSSVRRSAARHVYFTLKDEETQLAAVMFWRAAQTLPISTPSQCKLPRRMLQPQFRVGRQKQYD